MTDASEDAWCPRCDGILDRFSLHACLCAAHIMLYATLCVAGPRGPGCSLSARSLACSSPSTLSRGALTGAGQQTSTCRLTLEFLLPLTWPLLAHSDRKPLETSYAEVKRLHLDTAHICQTQGLRFIPLVVETTGAWEPEAAKVLHHIWGRDGAGRSWGGGPPRRTAPGALCGCLQLPGQGRAPTASRAG